MSLKLQFMYLTGKHMLLSLRIFQQHREFQRGPEPIYIYIYRINIVIKLFIRKHSS